jgi:hypothetical protein
LLLDFSPLTCLEVDFELITIGEVAFAILEGDGEDDGLGAWEVGVHPTIAYIEIGGRFCPFDS